MEPFSLVECQTNIPLLLFPCEFPRFLKAFFYRTQTTASRKILLTSAIKLFKYVKIPSTYLLLNLIRYLASRLHCGFYYVRKVNNTVKKYLIFFRRQSTRKDMKKITYIVLLLQVSSKVAWCVPRFTESTKESIGENAVFATSFIA